MSRQYVYAKEVRLHNPISCPDLMNCIKKYILTLLV